MVTPCFDVEDGVLREIGKRLGRAMEFAASGIDKKGGIAK